MTGGTGLPASTPTPPSGTPPTVNEPTAPGPRVAAARAICAACPVTTECLRDALDTRDHHGVRAGIDMATLPDRSRGKLRARLRAQEAA
jgi:hypothetical protein